jgi:hypothetical protein
MSYNLVELDSLISQSTETVYLEGRNGEIYYDSEFQNTLKYWSQESVMINRIIETLSPCFNFRNMDRVLGYLMSHQFILPLLKDCYQNLRKYFEDDSLFLEVIHDPMDNDDHLLLSIKITDVSKALDRLNQFDDDWWVNTSPKASGNLIIDVEF